MEDFSEISFPVPWGHISGRWYGDQTRRPIVALHGWLDNCGSFARLAPLLVPHVSLLCIDLPGHGYSTHLPTGIIYHNMEYVRTLLRLMKAYRWEKISLMGHSMGGAVIFLFASLYPDRVDMLVGIDIIKSRYIESDIVTMLVRHVMDRAVVDNERRQKATAMDEPPSYTFEECERLLYEGSDFSVYMENCKYILERNIRKSLKYPEKYYFSRDGRLKYLMDFNPSHELAKEMVLRLCRKETPYLVIRGGASTNISSLTLREIVPELEKFNKNFEMHVIDSATHHLHLNNPNETAKIIIDFWIRKGFIGTRHTNVVGEKEDSNLKTMRNKL